MDFLLGSAQPQPPPLQSSWAPSSSSTASSSPGQQQQQQLELLLLQTYSALLSPTQPMSHHFPLNLLNLAAALGQPATMPALGQQQWPAAQLTTMPTMADPLEAFGVAFGTQLARHLAELPSASLMLLPSNFVDSFPPGLALLPTCSPPNFHSRLLGPFSASHQITVEDLPPPASPSETSASANDGVEAEGGSHQPNSKGHRAHRLSYPREFKLIVLHSFRANGHNKYRTCKEFQITKSMLNGWLQKADKIRNSRPGSLKSGRSGRRPQFPRIERQLFEQFRAQAAQGQTVSNRWIRETARQLAAAGQRQEDAEGNGIPQQPIQCQFSERWLNNFKRRFGIQTTMAGGAVAHNMEKEQHALEGEEHALDMMAFGDNTLEEEEKQKSAAFAVENQHLQQQQTAMAEEMADSLLEEEKLTEEQWTKLGREICGSGQLPIQAFYARFPKLGQQPTVNLGRMGRKEEEEKQQKSAGTVAEMNKWR